MVIASGTCGKFDGMIDFQRGRDLFYYGSGDVPLVLDHKVIVAGKS